MFDTPHTGSYEPGTRHQASRPASGELSEHDRQCKRFDGALHGRISSATTREDWELLTTDLIAASAKLDKQVDALRENVKNRFLEDCPDPELRKKLNQALHAKKQGNVGHELRQQQAAKRHAEDAKKASNRARRHAAQPARGSSSGGGQKPGQQSKQKGGKKH